MVQPASDKPLSRPTTPRNDTLTADAWRLLHALSRELRQATDPKRKNDYPNLAPLSLIRRALLRHQP